MRRASMAGRLYPEWDYRRRRLSAGPLPRDRTDRPPRQARTGDRTRTYAAPIRHVRRHFEALRPQQRADARPGRWVRSRSLRAGARQLRPAGRRRRARPGPSRDAAAAARPRGALLVDVSLSTDAWVEDQRVLDVEKEALLVLAHGLSACGDEHAILTFTSRRRGWVRIETVKDFDEPMGAAVDRPHPRAEARPLHAHRRRGAPCRRRLAGQPQRRSCCWC